MTDLRKAAEMALEALDLAQSLTEESQHHGKILSSYKALRAALEQNPIEYYGKHKIRIDPETGDVGIGS